MRYGVLLLAVGMSVFGASAASAIVAPVDTTYNFKGACAPLDCTGFGKGELVLQNYIAGSALDDSNFVSWHYHSNLLTYSLSQTDTPTLTGSLGSTSGPANVTIFSFPFDFTSSTTGEWHAYEIVDLDHGLSGTWTTAAAAAVPEPVTLSLFGAGLAGMAGLRRRRKTAA